MTSLSAPAPHSKPSASDSGSNSSVRRKLKPCRFFQFGTCALSAQQCSFAHIKPVSTPQPCRYYLQGYCKAGIYCRYLHINWSGLHFLNSAAIFRGPQPLYHSLESPPEIQPYLSPQQQQINAAIHDSREYLKAREGEGIGMQIFPPDISSPVTSVASLATTSPTVTESTMYSPTSQSSGSTNRTKKGGYTEYRKARKADAFKTKLCKYYDPGDPTSCPAGGRCTFVHSESDVWDSVLQQTLRTERKIQPIPRKPLPGPEPQRNDVRCSSKYRIVGGGVMLGRDQSPEDVTKEYPINRVIENSILARPKSSIPPPMSAPKQLAIDTKKSRAAPSPTHYRSASIPATPKPIMVLENSVHYKDI